MHGIVYRRAREYVVDMVVPVSHLAGRRHLYVQCKTAFSTYHDHGRCLVRQLSPSLHGHKPGINYLLTFATLPHTRLLNIILNQFYFPSHMDFRFYHTVFFRFYYPFLILLGLVSLIVKRCRKCRLRLCRRRYTNFFD